MGGSSRGRAIARILAAPVAKAASRCETRSGGGERSPGEPDSGNHQWRHACNLAVAKANAEYNEKMGLNRGVTERVRERVRDGFDHPRTEMCVALLLVTNFVVSITQSELGIHEVQIDDDVSRYVQVYLQVYRSFCITCSTGHQRWM